MLPQTTPEQRQSYYGDVEALLSPGFLSHPVVVAGARMQMRSLGPGDLYMLKARTEGADSWEWRVWAVATSIWMVNGRSLLGKEEAIPFMTDRVRNFRPQAVDTLFSILLGLWLRAGEATETVQVYVYETHSRYKWLSTKRGHVSSGVPGADDLGPSIARRIWTAFNEMEDLRRDEDTAWEGFKLVASSNAPKAIKKLDNHDSNRRKTENEKRQLEMDRWYYGKLGLVNPQGEVISADGGLHRLKGEKTPDDLEEEMRRWVTGDHDLHDRIVADYKARIQAEHDERKRRQEEHSRRLEQKRREMGWENGEFRPQPLVALTAEQLQHALKNRGHRPGVTFLPKAPQADRLVAKYVQPADTGGLQVQDGKVVDPSANSQADQRTLDHLIRGRSPSFNQGG